MAVLKIRINGQLLLLMLTEKLIKVGAKMKQLNTDGILYLIPKSVDYQSVLSEWEKETKLTLESEEYEAFYQYAINDYLAVGKGYSETKNPALLKYKGCFIETTSLGKGMSPEIIAKAINKYFLDGTLPEETIKHSRDINDFLTYTKVDKKFCVEYDGKLIPRINRYYASTNGKKLYRCEVSNTKRTVPLVILHMKDGSQLTVPKDDIEIGGKHWYDPDVARIEHTTQTKTIEAGERSNYACLLATSSITIVNDLNEIKEFPKNINYSYYIQECYKIIEPLITTQLTLF